MESRTGYQLHYAPGVFLKLLRPQFSDILLSDTPHFKHLTFIRTTFLSGIPKIIKNMRRLGFLPDYQL